MIEQLELVPDIKLEKWVQHRECHYRISPCTNNAPVYFTTNTLRHLTLCSNLLSHLLPKPIQLELKKTLETTSEKFTSRERSFDSHAESWVKGYINYTPFQGILDKIQNAMEKSCLCFVDYKSRSTGKSTQLMVAPLRIIAFREAFYIRCHIYNPQGKPSGEFRTLAVHRIARFDIHHEHFKETPETDLEPFFGFPFHEPITICVAFRGGAATYVSERTWSKDQTLNRNKDGSITLTFTTTSQKEVIAWVLSFGDEAELLEPLNLRKQMQDTAKKIMSNYISKKVIRKM